MELTKIKSGALSKSLLQKVIEVTGEQRRFIRLIAENIPNQIRRIDPGHAKVKLTIELNLIADQYGNRRKLTDPVLQECTRLIFEKFNHLSISEIREAYRQHAAGEIESKGGEMFGGQFNAHNLGRVLSAFDERRHEVYAEILKAKSKQQTEEETKRRQEKNRQQFEKDFPRIIMEAKTTAESYHQVKAFWYEAAERRGMLSVPKEYKIQIMDLAKRLFNKERVEETKKMFSIKATTRTAKTIAKQLCVFHFLLKNDKIEDVIAYYEAKLSAQSEENEETDDTA